MTTPTQNAENLALIVQEILTAIVRLRSNRQHVSDAGAFRSQMRAALQAASQEARQKGYTEQDFRLAAFAVVAFLDESVLNSHNPVFASWPRKPLQEELFGGHVAGETFFENLNALLRAADSKNIADVLEVYDLCLLLGYQGRYTIGNHGELRAFEHAIAEKMRRIRGAGQLAPNWAPQPGRAHAPAHDPALRSLGYAAAALLGLALLLFLVFKFSLNTGVSAVHELAAAPAIKVAQ